MYTVALVRGEEYELAPSPLQGEGWGEVVQGAKHTSCEINFVQVLTRLFTHLEFSAQWVAPHLGWNNLKAAWDETQVLLDLEVSNAYATVPCSLR